MWLHLGTTQYNSKVTFADSRRMNLVKQREVFKKTSQMIAQ